MSVRDKEKAGILRVFFAPFGGKKHPKTEPSAAYIL
jgi:hypothetical protein